MFQHQWLLFLLAVIFLPVSGVAQTATELRQKYKVSSSIESYDVRPGIIATISYGEDGQVASILIAPPVAYDTIGIPKNEMPLKLVEEVLNELVPVSKRGEVCDDYGAMCSGSFLCSQRVDFENVSISSSVRGIWKPNVVSPPNATVRYVLIEWIKCAGKLRP
jgi:hypothetical protein